MNRLRAWVFTSSVLVLASGSLGGCSSDDDDQANAGGAAGASAHGGSNASGATNGGATGVNGGSNSAGGSNGTSGAANGGATASTGGATSANGGTSDETGGTTSSTNGGTTSASGGTGNEATGGAAANAGAGAGGEAGSPTSEGGHSSSTEGGAAGAAQTGGGAGSPSDTEGGAGNVTTCDHAPTVYVLVDRSSSMFDCISTTSVEASCADASDTTWSLLKTSVLSVIQQRQGSVRFGFASFTGTNPAGGGTCPIINQVAPAMNNYSAIASLYNGLPAGPNSTLVGAKFETPTRQSLDLIGANLLADSTPGEKYIVLVTDGQPDYCDDGNPVCPIDSVVAGLQKLKAQGVSTIVVGLLSQINDLPPSTLQAFANAGAGENTVAAMPTGYDASQIYDLCQTTSGWHADLVTSGKPDARGTTLGTYSTIAGPTAPLTPNGSDASALTTNLNTALTRITTCL